MSTPVRRNDPCPCGSGLRFKECHGKLDSGAPASLDALVQRALQHHQQGRIEQAEGHYREILARDGGNAIATHYLGMVAWHRGDLAEGERLMRASIAANPAIADFHNNLGLLLRDTRRLDEAAASFARTLEVDPGWIEAHNNLGLTLEAADRWDEAVAAYRRAIAAAPNFAAARQNLGRALLTRGEYREGWQEYRWRLAAQGLTAHAPAANESRLAATLAGRRLALRAEQGIGDVLFFLRFAPELARRGAELAFRGDPRLHPLLERTGLFALGFEAERAPASGLEPVFIGDLPWLLEADDAALFPPPLTIPPLPERVERWRSRLEALGPAPRVALTWRAGTATPGPVRTQLKEVTAAMLGQEVRGQGATWISVQRMPRAGEREALERSLAAPVHDASAANGDLEEILALLSAVDDYVGVSNANTHLRAAIGGSMRVLVPFPPEWRWGLAGERSPWFPAMKVIRQKPNGTWPHIAGRILAGSTGLP